MGAAIAITPGQIGLWLPTLNPVHRVWLTFSAWRRLTGHRFGSTVVGTDASSSNLAHHVPVRIRHEKQWLIGHIQAVAEKL
jgi:hypothetical protein